MGSQAAPSLPPELLTLIFRGLSYWDLVATIPRVCKLWSGVLTSDPILRIKTFKQRTEEYIYLGSFSACLPPGIPSR
jgi:hypothetical protein